MSYNRQLSQKDLCEYGGAVGVLLILLLFVYMVILAGSGLRQLPDSSLWGLVDWGPFHNYAAPQYNLLAMTGSAANIAIASGLTSWSRP